MRKENLIEKKRKEKKRKKRIKKHRPDRAL